MNEDNQHYRYCFFCEKWKTKEEINEVDWGKNNRTFNCNVCRKDLGDTIQIFRCPDHEEIILKVWGVLEGENKEKVFFKECPEEKQKEEQPQPPETIGARAFWIIGGGIIFIGGLAWIIYYFFKGGKNE